MTLPAGWGYLLHKAGPSEPLLSETSQRENRRSTRVLAHVPIIVAGAEAGGRRFEARGETLVVNKQGAKIQTHKRLTVGTTVRITCVPTRKSQEARVVWVDEQFGTIAVLRFGVELERPENFWGIYLPPEDWGEPAGGEEGSVAARVAALGRKRHERPETPASPAGAEAGADSAGFMVPLDSRSGHPELSRRVVKIPRKGVEVFVRGISSARIPFQEKTLLRRAESDEVTVHVRLVMDVPGAPLRVVFPRENLILKARTSGVSSERERGKWKLWIKFTDPIRLLPG